MSTSGQALVDGIQRDLACPQCDYNLRGLRGEVVSCPECGAVCDVAKLVSQRWTKPWHQAPGLGTVYLPTAWAVLVVLALLTAFTALGWTGRLLVLLIGLGGWCWLMWLAQRLFQTSEGLHLALAGHLILTGYLMGVVGCFAGVLYAVSELPTNPLHCVILSPVPVVSLAAVWLCHRAEVMVAKRCIRGYLATRVGPD